MSGAPEQLACDRCGSLDTVTAHLDCNECGPIPLCASCGYTHQLEREVEQLREQRDYLLGRLIDLKIDRMTRSTEGEFTHADTMFWADRARRKHLFAASQDDEYGSDVDEPNGYYRELARGEQP